MNGNGRRQIGAVSRQLQDVTAAKAKPDRRAGVHRSNCAFCLRNHRLECSFDPASPNSAGRGPAPYMLATKTAQRFPATNSPRSIALSVIPIQFGATSTAGRFPDTFSSNVVPTITI